MQVFGLPRPVIRMGAVASRIAAHPPHSEAAIRRDAVARWLELRSHGLTAEQAARRLRPLEALSLAGRGGAQEPASAAPFRVRGIQVDGGSEFRAEFEEACRDRGLALYVLPPKRPQLNGAVERAQGSWRYEFYARFDLPHRIDKLQQHVDAFAHRFNHHRPHQALGGRTPAEYLASISSGHPPASHMC